MHLFQWAFRRFSKPSQAGAENFPLPTWPGSPDLPSGLAQSDDTMRKAILVLARQPGVERVALLRANGGLFCGRNDAGKEEFSRAVQTLVLAGRRASRRMGLGAIESIVLEDEASSVVIGAGHSVCGVQCSGAADSEGILAGLASLAGLSSAQNREEKAWS